MPMGLYHRVQVNKLKHGDIAAVCLPSRISQVGRQRGYLLRGHCADHSIPVLKEIIALPNDTVLVTKKFMIVNDHYYFAPQAQFDHQHHRIQQFINNAWHPLIHTIWLYGANDPAHSWDSRYFGGVPKPSIIGVYQPLLTF